jgi:hypothetical protein
MLRDREPIAIQVPRERSLSWRVAFVSLVFLPVSPPLEAADTTLITFYAYPAHLDGLPGTRATSGESQDATTERALRCLLRERAG